MGCIIELKARNIELIRSGWLIEIDNTGTPEQAVNAIVDHIVADQCARLGKVG